MTPQLQQAIKLLQLSNLELAAFVEAELERNPLLERDESGDGPVEDAARARRQAPARGAPATAARRDWLDATTGGDARRGRRELDTDYDNVYPEDDRRRRAPAAEPTRGWTGHATAHRPAAPRTTTCEAYRRRAEIACATI